MAADVMCRLAHDASGCNAVARAAATADMCAVAVAWQRAEATADVVCRLAHESRR